MPYVELSDPAERTSKDGDSVERGLVFIALNASIERQFEFLQRAWINEPNFNTLDGVDPVVSTRDGHLGQFRFHRDSTYQPVEQFVRLRGGEYFFMPRMKALELLAKGEFSSAS